MKLKNTHMFSFAKLSQSGPSIQIEDIGRQSINKKFLVEFKQLVYVESDLSKRCKNYPNKFDTYNSCDEAWMRDVLKEHYPQGEPSNIT